MKFTVDASMQCTVVNHQWFGGFLTVYLNFFYEDSVYYLVFLIFSALITLMEMLAVTINLCNHQVFGK
jgi:hypothetical protein